MIDGYLGSGEVFAYAVCNLAMFYADRTVLDHQTLIAAVNKGQIVVETGI